MTNKTLNGLTIIDLSHRLPGPLATHILEDLGARIIKIEDKEFSDPFKHGLFKEMDPSFPVWYEELNAGKEIKVLDFNSQTDQDLIRNLIKDADACLLGIPEKVQTKLGLSNEFKKSIGKPFVFLTMQAMRESNHSLHDLNALAQLDLLSLFIQDRTDSRVDPPFLPLAGITFGQQVATELVACLLRANLSHSSVLETSYLIDANKRVLSPFWSDKLQATNQKKFLHNGLYPCYSIYKTQDNFYVAIAMVEEKFWVRFCQLFELTFSPQDRFIHHSDHVFLSLENLFSSKSLNEIRKMAKDENICMSFLK